MLRLQTQVEIAQELLPAWGIWVKSTSIQSPDQHKKKKKIIQKHYRIVINEDEKSASSSCKKPPPEDILSQQGFIDRFSSKFPFGPAYAGCYSSEA